MLLYNYVNNHKELTKSSTLNVGNEVPFSCKVLRGGGMKIKNANLIHFISGCNSLPYR